MVLDQSRVNMFCAPAATISLQNVTPGMHILTAVPALNDHTEVEENANAISFDYEPAHVLPAIANATFAAAPAITILSPKNGDTVSGSFAVIVKVVNYHFG